MMKKIRWKNSIIFKFYYFGVFAYYLLFLYSLFQSRNGPKVEYGGSVLTTTRIIQMISNRSNEQFIGFHFVACYAAQGEMTQNWSENVRFLAYTFGKQTLPSAVDRILT